MPGPPTAAARTLRFGDFALDLSRGALLHRGTRLRLQPQPYRVLEHLALRAPALVTREELGEAIWSGVHVDLDQSLNYCIRQVRNALHDSAAEPRFIETLPKQGYRFIASIDIPLDSHAPTPVQPSPRRLTLLTAAACALLATAAFFTWRHHTARATPAATQSTAVHPGAHDEYLRGRYLWVNGQTSLAGEHFLAATRLQPDYAPAWSGLAYYYGASAIKGELSPADSIALTAQTAHTAIALDNKLPEAHIGLSAAYLLQSHDPAAALAEADRALALDPHYAEGYHFKAKILSALQRHDEAIATQRRASELDPSARPWALAQALTLARHYDDALREAQQRIESNPHDPALRLTLAGIYRRMGRTADYATTLALAYEQQGDPASAIALRSVFAQTGYPGIVRWQLQRLQSRAAKQYVSPVDLALLHAQLRERDQTLALLEDAARQQAPALLWLQCDPAFDFLHNDPRLHAALQHTGLPAV